MLRSIRACERPTMGYWQPNSALATRDVTEVIAGNPIAVFVLCYRVIKKDGLISGYRWGVKRKRALLAREQNCKDFCLE
jgi:AraC family transcriptional regulator, regulatory protein of adaptative response / methylated-DNA-[protein]-cysteine methyltransferase